MKLKLQLVSLLVAAAFAIAAVGCGTTVCESACEKQKSCVQNLDCAASGPACEFTKQMLGQLDCSAAGDACSGQTEAAFKELDSCELDPATCECKK